MAAPKTDRLFLYVGTNTGDERDGIYVFEMDQTTGALTYVTKKLGLDNPAFLAIHPENRYLYCVNEVDEFEGQATGAVCALSIDSSTGELNLLNRQSSGGAGPCQISLDQTGKVLLVANYMGGSVASLPIEADGRLGEVKSVIQHEGSSVKSRQTVPHPHMIRTDLTNQFVYSPDLGIDKVMIYRVDANSATLTPNDPPSARLQAGAGPRHLAFHPDDPYAYVINELDSTITVFGTDSGTGAFQEIEIVKIIPEGLDVENYPADIQVATSGKFLYGTNRGHDSIVICAIGEAGKLSVIGHESTQGEYPWNIAIDPSARFLFTCNQRTDSVVVFRLDSGKLTRTGHSVEVPKPMCLEFLGC